MSCSLENQLCRRVILETVKIWSVCWKMNSRKCLLPLVAAREHRQEVRKWGEKCWSISKFAKRDNHCYDFKRLLKRVKGSHSLFGEAADLSFLTALQISADVTWEVIVGDARINEIFHFRLHY